MKNEIHHQTISLVNLAIGIFAIIYSAWYIHEHLTLLYRGRWEGHIMSSFYFRQYMLTSWFYILILLTSGILMFFKSKQSLTNILFQFTLLGLMIEFIINRLYWQLWGQSFWILIPYFTFLIYFSLPAVGVAMNVKKMNWVKIFSLSALFNLVLSVVTELLRL